jgi:acyl carrier protein
VNRVEIQAVLAEVLAGIAPDADLASVSPDAVLRDALDLDSMDLLSVYTALHARLGVEIPEVDYPQLATLSGLLSYLERNRA